jgi:hypothetical protein
MSFDAFCGSSQILGSSASWFSSARRRSDFSKSKRPPQQPDRLLDLFDDILNFGAHDRFRLLKADVAARDAGRNFARLRGKAASR